MPVPVTPLTPISSSDIKGQDGTRQLASLHLAFELPPPAVNDAAQISPIELKHHSSPAFSNTDSKSSPYPIQPAESVKSRQRSNTGKMIGKEAAFSLPPPPTRSRKIIQMNPRSQEDEQGDTEARENKKAGRKGQSGSGQAKIKMENPGDAAKGPGKKRQATASTAAGRKIARKTAHSLIERRRRSKMNEEFGVLKGLIPACTGEMHKLAILQASIEYVRYLQDCVEKLKAQHKDDQSWPGSNPLPSIREFHPTFQSEDLEMTDSEMVSPSFTAVASRSHQPSVSPALLAQDSRHRQHSYSSASGDQRHYNYSYSHSAATSPAFGPINGSHSGYQQIQKNVSFSTPGSALTSPALVPQNDHDHEATAALLMLNNDRRGSKAGTEGCDNGRGLSVKELLSN